MQDANIKLGQLVEDEISGFLGIVTTAGDHLTGCERFGVQAVGDTGSSRMDEEFFYEDQLTVVEEETDFTDDSEKFYLDHDFELGNRVRDEVTGFEGVVSVINYKLWNVPSVCIKSTESRSDEKPENFWVDLNRITEVSGYDCTGEFGEEYQDSPVEETGPVSDSRNRNDSR